MFFWAVITCLWLYIDIGAKSDKDQGEGAANQLHAVWPVSTVSLDYDDIISSPSIMPFFDNAASFMNLTVQSGGEAQLHCRVHELTAQTTVSWLKRQEGQLRLLSVGRDLYSGDPRYAVALQESNDWTLSLRAAKETDEGLYQCQVSSHPPIVHTLYLHVIVPELEIWDERGIPIRNKFYNSGSTIELKCTISKVPKPTQFILWKHGTNILNYDVTRGGISVKTDLVNDGVKSRLFIASVGPADSGNYTCSLPDVAETTVAVHVLNGETPAAMQHGGSTSNIPTLVHLCAILTCVLLLNSR